MSNASDLRLNTGDQVDGRPQGGNTVNSITSKQIPTILSTPVEPNMTADRLVPGTFYKMETNNRGLFVIINNRDFLPGSGFENDPRNGTDVDCKQMKKLFTELGFQVEVHTNVTTQEMRAVFMAVSKKDHSRYSAFGCCILSHGDEGAVFGTDDMINIKELTEMLRDTKLNGKPKLFFIQACQGTDYMETVTANAPRADPEMDTDSPENLKIPSEADFMYAYSTVPGYLSWRDSENGSWFIQAVTKVFRANAHKLDVGRMLTRVNLEVSKFEYATGEQQSDQIKQISSIVSQLRYDLYLFPPNGPLTSQSYPQV